MPQADALRPQPSPRSNGGESVGVMCRRASQSNTSSITRSAKKGEGGYNEKILVLRHPCGLGRIGIRYTNIGVMICSWILGEVSELDTLKVGPSEAGDQFQFDKQTDPQTTAPAMHQHSQNLPS